MKKISTKTLGYGTFFSLLLAASGTVSHSMVPAANDNMTSQRWAGNLGIHLAQVGDGAVGGTNGEYGAGGGDGGRSDHISRENRFTTNNNARANPTITNAIVVAIEAGGGFCAQVPEEYLVSCIAQSLRTTAAAMPTAGDYGESRKILLESARKLEKIVTDNKDTSKPAVSITSKRGKKKIKLDRVTPIKPEKAKVAKSQAVAVLAEAETRLLRSPDNSQKSLAYQKIAAAVDSNKILLRST